jgi:hypothetical protein
MVMPFSKSALKLTLKSMGLPVALHTMSAGTRKAWLGVIQLTYKMTVAINSFCMVFSPCFGRLLVLNNCNKAV